MALWHDDITGDQFDDGLKARPGEEGFTRDLAEAHYGHKNFSYTGTPNWEPPAAPQEPASDESASADPAA